MKLIAGRQWFFSLSLSLLQLIQKYRLSSTHRVHQRYQHTTRHSKYRIRTNNRHIIKPNGIIFKHPIIISNNKNRSVHFFFSSLFALHWCALFSTLQICNHLKSMLTWPTEYLLALFHHIAFIISDFDCTKLNNTSVLYSFFSLLCDSIRFRNSNNNSYRIDHCCITYWVERQHHITEIIVHRVQVSGFNNNFLFFWFCFVCVKQCIWMNRVSIWLHMIGMLIGNDQSWRLISIFQPRNESIENRAILIELSNY